MRFFKAQPCPIPAICSLADSVPSSNFADAYRIDNPNPNASAVELAIEVFTKMPKWIDWAMSVRNGIVKRLGLKDLSTLSAVALDKAAADYKVGERIGAFLISHISANELVMGDSDKHLDVNISVLKTSSNQLVVTTVVHIHNWLGTAYRFFVKPAHRLIAPAALSRISR